MSEDFNRFVARLRFDSETGKLFWRERPQSDFKCLRDYRAWNARMAGKIVGHVAADGYRRMSFDNRLYQAHRVAWLLHTGAWPKHHIDHVNGEKDDNRILNLRDVEQSVNNQNTRRPLRTSKTGVLGVYKKASGKFLAVIRSGGKNIPIGLFDSPEDAHAAYVHAKRALHVGCTL